MLGESGLLKGGASAPRSGSIVRACIIGLVAFGLLAMLSLIFAREAGRVAAIWPANGALLALVLLRPNAERAWLVAGAFAGNIAATLAMGDALGVSIGLSVANALEVGIVAWAMRGVDAREGVLQIEPMKRFVLAGGLIGPAASAVVAAATLALWHDQPLGPNILRWLTADALGMLVVVPPLLLVSNRTAWSPPSSAMSQFTMAALLAGILALVFLQGQYPILFLIPPVLVLIAFRCGAGPAGAALLISSAVSLAAVAVGVGPMALIEGGLDGRALIQQLFLAVLVFTILPIISVLKSRADSEARYRLLADAATDVVARFDPTGKFLYVSPSAKTVLGREPEAMLGKDCTGIIVDEDLDVIRRTLRAYVAAGPDAPAPRYEYRLVKPGGEIIWMEATPRAIRDAEGHLVEFHDCVRDITGRKALEREQAELVDALKMAEATASLGHWRLDVATQRVTWSDEVYRIHGVDRASFDPSYDDAVGFYHPDDQQKVRDWVEAGLGTGQSGEFRLRIIRADGEERTVTSVCVPQTDDAGTTIALFGVFQDITDIVRSHEQVAASEARYRLLADNATDIIATYGIDGVFRYISPAIEGPMGYRPDELVGRPFYEFMHPDDVERVKGAFVAYFKAGPDAEPPRVAYRAMPKHGGTVWLEAHPKLIRDVEGKPAEFQDVVRDISETKKLEDALTQARDVAEAAAQAKSDFLANMSHELRTPLTGVIGFSGLLKASPNLAEAERRYADRIGTASEALLCVINDILDYSKLEADAVELDPQPFNARALAEETAGIVEGQAQAKGLALTLDVSADLPVALMADGGRLRQVMLNFLSNAVKFTASGGVTLGIGTTGERLRVTVADTGIGIPAEKINQLFERFTQADASTTRQYGGTGLGLAISRRLIEMMGGEIGADSRPGEGSTFWFEIPLIIAEDTADAGDMGDLTIPVGTRILMADDAAANRELVTAIMASFDLTLDAVCDGAQAVEAARFGAYDLILMDVHMPVMDGLEATRLIRAMDGPAGRTPVVALTANVQPEHVQRCAEAGMDDHVGKPIHLSELMTAIARALASSPEHAAEKVKLA